MLRSLAVVIALAGTAYADKAAPVQAPAPMSQPPLPPPPQPPPEPVKPAEVAAVAKQVAGNYACKGVTFVGNGASTPLAAKLSIKLALGGAWLEASLVENRAGGMSFEDYRTFDSVAQQWTRLQLASTTGHVMSTSLGDKSGTWTWEGTATAPSGTMQVRDYEQMGDRQLKLWGEALLGGSWQKLYELTCKR
jgi:hypothetical protein